MKVIDKLAWVLVKDNKVLMVRSFNKTLFYLPGGKRDPGETDIQALVREIQEEMSVDLIPGSCKKVGEVAAKADGKAEGVEVKLTCYFAEYKGELQIASEIEEMAWLGLADMDQLSLAAQKVVLELKQQGYLTMV